MSGHRCRYCSSSPLLTYTLRYESRLGMDVKFVCVSSCPAISLRVCLLACLRARMPARLTVCVPACVPACKPSICMYVSLSLCCMRSLSDNLHEDVVL